jgi:hypothetical protein
VRWVSRCALRVMLRHPPAAQLQVITANERRSPRGRQCPSALVKCDTPSFARSFAFCRGASRVLSAVISRKRNDTSRHKRKGGKLLYSKVRELRVVRADEPLVWLGPGETTAQMPLECPNHYMHALLVEEMQCPGRLSIRHLPSQQLW